MNKGAIYFWVFMASMACAIVFLVTQIISHNTARVNEDQRVRRECIMTNWRRLTEGKYQDIQAKWVCADGQERWMIAPSQAWEINR